MKENKTRNLVFGALIAAIYVVLTMVFRPISFGPIQFRISEALCVLPYFTPAAIPGVFIGCLISNLLGGSVMMDVIFGSLATLLGALGTRLLRKNRWLACLPPIVSNVIIVPFVLTYAYGIPGGIPWFMLTVGIGEVITCGLLGQLVWKSMDKHKDQLFK